MIIEYKPVGVIHSPFKETENMPIQSSAAETISGRIDLFPEFVPGLKDLDGFSHLILLYHFHLVEKTRLTVVPFLDTEEHGVFATRAPVRPNPVGLSIVRLIRVFEGSLEIRGVDIVDGTPLLDIKPYLPQFDHRDVEKTGWLSKGHEDLNQKRSDGRFR